MRRLAKLLPMTVAGLMRMVGRAISLVTPKNRSTWIIGSWDGHRFADNAKWLFLWYHADQSRLGGCTLTWLSRSRHIVATVRELGLPAVWTWSPKGMLLSVRAGVQILDSDSRGTAPWSIADCVSVNLFHGIALKHIGADIRTPGNLYTSANYGSLPARLALWFLAPWFSERYTATVASSESNARTMASAFPRTSAVWNCGLPRNDTLVLDDHQLEKTFGIRLSRTRNHADRTVVYMPTFRDYDRSGRELPLPWGALEDLLERHSARLVLRLHSNDAARTPRLAANSRVSFHASSEDPYLLLRKTDVLVTDYSSIMFDYLLTDRPVILYCYDLDTYTTQARGLYYSLDDIAPGPIAHTESELLLHLDDALAGRHGEYTTRRARTRSLMHSSVTDSRCKAVAAKIAQKLEGTRR